MLRAPIAIVPALLAASLLAAGCSSTPEDKTAGWTTERIYAEARDELNGGGYDKAVPLFEKLEGRAAGTPLAQQAQLDKAYANTKGGEKAQALATLDRFMKLHPPAPRWTMRCTSRAGQLQRQPGHVLWLSQQDLSERDQKAAKDSFESFREADHPLSRIPLRQDARLRMTYIVNSLAQYEVHVARYYFERGAYVAAISRAQSGWSDYQAVPATEEAPVHPDPVLRCPGADPIARRRAPRHGRLFPPKPLPDARSQGQERSVVEALRSASSASETLARTATGAWKAGPPAIGGHSPWSPTAYHR